MTTKSLILFILLPLGLIGQWNIQTGYDFGTYTIPVTQRKNFNNSHRVNLVNEYIFTNKVLVSLNSGIDLQKINYISNNRINGSNENSFTEYISENEINIQTYRLGLSLGYQFEITPLTNILFKISYDQYFVNNVSIKKGYQTKNSYSVPSSEIDNYEPTVSTKEFSPNIDFQRIGYRNKFLKENRNLVFSLIYRYHIHDFFISPSISFSPFNEGFVLFPSQNLFLFGVNLGYTFPQKDQNNEK